MLVLKHVTDMLQKISSFSLPHAR